MKLAVGGMACSSCAGGEAPCADPALPLLRRHRRFVAATRSPACLERCLVCSALLFLPRSSFATRHPLAARLQPAPPCAAAVEAALLQVPGAVAASVSLTLEQAEVQYGEGLCTREQLVAAVEAAGFEAAGAGGGRVQCWRAMPAPARALPGRMGLLSSTWLCAHWVAPPPSRCAAQCWERRR